MNILFNVPITIDIQLKTQFNFELINYMPVNNRLSTKKVFCHYI